VIVQQVNRYLYTKQCRVVLRKEESYVQSLSRKSKPHPVKQIVHCATEVKILTRTDETDLVNHEALFEDIFESKPE